MSQNAIQISTTPPLPGATLVADINAANDSLARLFSGSAAPTASILGLGSLSGLPWHDTANNLLKLRDQADSAWMVIGGFDETDKLWKPPIGGGTGTLASAATTDLGTAGAAAIQVTGTGSITGLGNTAPAGQVFAVAFAGAATLVNNATSLILPNNGANIAAAAGDTALFEALGGGNWRCLAYQRASGQALQGGGSGSGIGTISGGAGIGIGGTGGSRTVTNSGVISFQAGSGISLSGGTTTSGNVAGAAITIAGNIAAGSGISISAGAADTIVNTGVISLHAGANITLSGGTTVSGNVAGTALTFGVATGTTGAVIPLLNGDNTFSGNVAFTGGLTYPLSSNPLRTATSGTITASDAGLNIVYTGNVSQTVYLPNNFEPGYSTGLIDAGTGLSTLSALSGATIVGNSGTIGPRAQYSAIELLVITNIGGSSATYLVLGDPH